MNESYHSQLIPSKTLIRSGTPSFILLFF